MSASTAISLLRQHLEAKREAGRTHVAVSSAAVKLLGGLRAKAEHQIRDVERALDEVERRGEVVADARAAVSAASEARNPLILPVEGASKAEKLQKLRALAEQSPAARDLGTLRTTMVFAVGNPDARLMLVGEAPGFQEEKQGEPFVGPAGEKLTQILKAMGVARSDVYISNICKFRPSMEPDENGPQGTRNRKPTEAEMRACLPFVTTEIDIIKPACIVALGATAAEGLGLSGSVGRLRGQVHEVSGIPTLVTFHPSYILREEKMGDGMKVKRQVWEDMLTAMEILELPISAKQRSYFKAG
jgi:DNA polymerase